MHRELAIILTAIGGMVAWLYSRNHDDGDISNPLPPEPVIPIEETTPNNLPEDVSRETWSRDDLIELLRTSAVKYEIPPELLINLAIAESNLDPDAVGVTGDIGIMQLNPKYHPTGQATDPVWAIDYGAKYLKSLYKQTGSWENALIAYNWGIGNFQKYGAESAPESTKNYVKKILE